MDDARELARSRAYELARAIDRAYELARAIDRTHDLPYAHVSAYASAIVSALSLARAFADRRDHDLALILAIDHAHTRARDFSKRKRGEYRVQLAVVMAAVEHARGLAARLHDLSAVDGGQDAARAPWRVAVRATEWLVRVLPVTEQTTYREIYWSELFELAEATRSRRAQLGYTLRVLAGVVALRRVLRMPAPLPVRRGGETGS